MGPIAISLIRGLVQFAWGALASQFGVMKLIPESLQNQATDYIVLVVVSGGTLMLLRWLESRTGGGFWPQLARLAGKILMVGMAGKQPVYPASAPLDPAAVATLIGYDNGVSKRVAGSATILREP